MGKFTAEEIQIAKAVDLVDLAEQIGIPLKRKGRFYQAVGMDSVMIFNRSSWCRFSQGVGGSTIDFLEYFRNMDFVEAVKYLLEFAGYIRTETMQKFQPERQIGMTKDTKKKKDIPKEPFVLPSKIRNQPPVIWIPYEAEETVKAGDRLLDKKGTFI